MKPTKSPAAPSAAILLALLASLSLSACTDDSLAPSPAPTPSPTPTPPPPPPPPPPAPTLSNLATSQTFSTSGVSSLGLFRSSTVRASTTDFGDQTIQLSYDAATSSYRLVSTTRETPLDQIFGPSSRTTLSSNNKYRTDAVFTTYEIGANQNGSVGQPSSTNNNQILRLFNPGAGNTRLSLSYVSYGIWEGRFDSRIAAADSQIHFAYGLPTTSVQRPSTGTARYTGIFDGGDALNGSAVPIGGTVTLDANFASGALTGRFDFTTADSRGGSTTVPLVSLQATSTLAGGATSWSSSTITSLTPDTSVTSGQWTGGLFGPNAQEAGGIIRATVTGNASNSNLPPFGVPTIVGAWVARDPSRGN
jgi:hypothetical protein